MPHFKDKCDFLRGAFYFKTSIVSAINDTIIYLWINCLPMTFRRLGSWWCQSHQQMKFFQISKLNKRKKKVRKKLKKIWHKVIQVKVKTEV